MAEITKVLLFDDNGDRILTNGNSPVKIHSKSDHVDLTGVFSEGASINAVVVGTPGNSVQSEPTDDGNADGFYKISRD